MDADCKIDDFVNVSLRIRPVLSQDNTESSCLQVISTKPPVLLVLDRSQTYNFDNIFKEEADQETVYDETVRPLVDYVKQGFSCTVFAYGQTGTGKTYTMGTSSQIKNPIDAGLIPRALQQFFSYCAEDIEANISISFIEIYNEKVFDLLQNNKPPLMLKGFRIEGLSQEKIFNYHEAKHFLKMGNKNRHSSETKQNPNSSRSHAIFTIYYNVRHKDYEMTSKLNLVDLAGCESVKKTGNQGSTFQEGVNINKGLLCIGQVMTALSTNSSFIPYRQSVITTILQDSLNRKNRVSLIACVNGNPEDCNETLQTLEFAQRVKRMRNKPEVNEVITQYKKDNPALFQPIRTSSTPFKRPVPQFQTPCLAKRKRTLPLRPANEPLGHSTTTDSPKSLSSISLASIASSADIVCQTVSPVVKKYMAAMECTLADRIEGVIMDRMEALIQNTLKRPTRASLVAEKNNKENTPSMSWSRIQDEVSKLVRTEIVQLTLKATRATSSPIEDQDGLDKIRKVLKYESPAFEGPKEEVVGKREQEPVFKIPDLPFSRKKFTESKRTPSISPIEYPLKTNELNDDKLDFGVPPCNGRRFSIRLAEKEPNKYNDSTSDDTSFNKSHYGKRRCSVRLSQKRAKQAQKTNNNSLDDFDLDASEEVINRSRAVKRRKDVTSKRKASKSRSPSKLTVKATPAGTRLLKNQTNRDSPATAHTKSVLESLNVGNAKQLEKLHTIGPKTAQQILLFRKIKGPLNKISDLSAMPGWHGKKFKQFVEQNFIKCKS